MIPGGGLSDLDYADCITLLSEHSSPATVRMVSNSGPPLPMPMRVPPGHLVQQIVDEEGILTHVILSLYPGPGQPPPPVPPSASQTGPPGSAALNPIAQTNGLVTQGPGIV
ncbi:unnamed protein product, partial [Echinostoma caproni]|uniref:Homeobox protein Meis2 n=1 Tax=Echinostoma caproni TaxID=27848 RepID=A0A183BE45_9TREM